MTLRILCIYWNYIFWILLNVFVCEFCDFYNEFYGIIHGIIQIIYFFRIFYALSNFLFIQQVYNVQTSFKRLTH